MSIGSYEKALSVTNLSSENNLPTFQLNAPDVIRAKVKKCEQTYYKPSITLRLFVRTSSLLP